MRLDELEALLVELPELKVVQHCLAGGDKPVDTVKIEPLQRRALGSMERKHGEAIVAAVNWCRSEGIAAARENERLRGALERIVNHPNFVACECGEVGCATTQARAALGASHDAG
jgi:hypothetical protein